MSEIPKTYEPQAIEEKWYAFWLESGSFIADPASSKPAYSIVIPPPNVTGVLTMGHTLNVTIQDILARRARMQGKEVLWLPGTDHAGIATQTVVERTLKKQGAIKHRDDLGREKFLEKVWEWKEKHGGIIIQQLKKLGASCDWSRERFTMDEHYSECVSRVFVELYKKGLIYRGKRMVNWDPVSLTALSDEEVNMKPQNGAMYHFNVEIAEQPGAFLTIATTRPETIPGDTAVAVNPKDPRYAHLIGQHVIRPLPHNLPREQKLVPIVGDEHVDFEFGTGVLKVTPAHDKADFEIGQRHRLPVVDIMNPNGTMNALAGEQLAGLDRFEARAAAVERLRELGALVKEEPYQNNVGYSERTDVPIEPRLTEQWWLRYPSREEAHHCVERSDLALKSVAVVTLTGEEVRGAGMRNLREAALQFARDHHLIGGVFENLDSGLKLRIRRKSLSHAFSKRGDASIKAVAALPELIRTAIHVATEPHYPPHPDFRRVHRFIAALRLGRQLFRVQITGKELQDGTVLYDHQTKKVAFGGKSLVPHPGEGKLDIQPAPNATIQLRDLRTEVKDPQMRFHPERWAKVYDHWMTNLQDWCISRQLWWGHRVPVWYREAASPDGQEIHPAGLPRSTDEIKHEELGPEVGGELEWSSTITSSSIPDGRREELPAVTTQAATSDCVRETYCGIHPPDGEGWTQDPDVLDTWFSSWLWPFATMGWPEKTDTLAKFYPTTDLVTGPDIIFFWVARMIMAGYELMSEMPFRNVYFTGIIRDKQGRKMSKSLGNSPDPLDLIAKFGADALRFGVMRSAPQGQDVLYDEKNIELARNFCTKLWNAARFRQMQAGETEGEIDRALLTSDDKWLLLRLDAAIVRVSKALDEYQFSEAAQALYAFFWTEYCDWYLEASKASLQSEEPARKANTLAVIDFTLAHLLRLFHPFLPFITEELWHSLGYHQDLPENQGGRTLMYATWPKPLGDDFRAHYGLDETDEQFANAKYEVVNQGRSLRRDFNIASNKRVRFIFKPNADLPAHEANVIKLLLNAEILDLVGADFTAPRGTPTIPTPLGELYLPLEGLIDADAERDRLHKEIAKVEQELTKVIAKLSNETFVNGAPANVVAEHRQRQADWQEKRAHLERLLTALG